MTDRSPDIIDSCLAQGSRQAMLQAFQMAWDAHPQQRHDQLLELASKQVRLRILGNRLFERMIPAFSHLLVKKLVTPLELTIELWDSAASETPSPIDFIGKVLPDCQVFGLGAVGKSSDHEITGYQNLSLIALLDRRAGHLVGVVVEVEKLTHFDVGKPLQPLIFSWLMDRDVVPVHAGLVAWNEKGVLFGGKGGSGKSTSTLSCLQSGFHYLGDDYIGLPPIDNSGCLAHSLYCSAHLEESHGNRFPWLNQAVLKSNSSMQEKLMISLGELFPDRLKRSVNITAIVLPRVCLEQKTFLQPIPAVKAALALAPSSILQLPFIDPRRSFERISELVQAVPCYSLTLGPNMEAIPKCIVEMLDQLPDS